MSLQVIAKSAGAATRAAASKQMAAASMSTTAESYTERQARLGRPLSPHVTVYKFPLTALVSISNRGTGMGMAAGFAATSALALVGADIPAAIYAAQDLIPGFAPISKLMVAFPVTFHAAHAARHVLWGAKPELINNVDALKSNYAVIGTAAVLSLAAASYTIKAPAKSE